MTVSILGRCHTPEARCLDLAAGPVAISTSTAELPMRSVPSSLSILAHHATGLSRPLARVSGSSFPLGSLATNRHWSWMHGVRCGPAVTEVAVPFDWCAACDAPLSMAADRNGTLVVVDLCFDGPRRPRPLEDLVVDAALRLLGVATPEATATPAAVSDGVWLDRIFDLCLLSPLGEPPAWPMIAALHPCARGIPTSEMIRYERERSLGTWSALRGEVLDGHADWLPVPVALADWFDEGSFARWAQATIPDMATMVGDVAELLRPSDFRRVLSTLDHGRST